MWVSQGGQPPLVWAVVEEAAMLEPDLATMRALLVPVLLGLAGGLILVLVDPDSSARFLGLVPLAVGTVLAARVIFFSRR